MLQLLHVHADTMLGIAYEQWTVLSWQHYCQYTNKYSSRTKTRVPVWSHYWQITILKGLTGNSG